MYDLAVIGGGSAGITMAKFGPKLGARVAIIEANKLGGDCTWTGCVPSKSLIQAARVAHTVRGAGAFGIHVPAPEVDFAAVTAHVRAIQEAVYAHDDAPEVLRSGGATVIEGRARFRSAEELEVNGQIIRARHFCIATGSHPKIPAVEGLEEAGYITNETIFQLTALPARWLVIGGGPIGCELGQSLQRLGASVTIVQRGAHLLPKDDAAMGPALQTCLEAEGIVVHCDTNTEQVVLQDGAKQVTLRHADGSTSTVTVDQILVAAGRTPNLKELGLEVAGIDFDEKGIKVDEHLRTSNPKVYACGDVIGRYQFTHVAAAEAGLILRNVLFPRQSKMSYSIVPWATFTDPEVAHVGLTEAAARAQYGQQLHVYELPWSANDRARTESETTGFTKILTVGVRDTIVGAHIIGEGAGDLINNVVIAMANGVGAGALGSAIGVYPTRALGVKHTAQQSFNRWLESRLGRTALRTYFKLFGAKA